jgi:hypothetical protein
MTMSVGTPNWMAPEIMNVSDDSFFIVFSLFTVRKSRLQYLSLILANKYMYIVLPGIDPG